MPPGVRRPRSSERGQLRWGQMTAGQAPVTGFKTAVAVIVFHFICQIMVQFADILLPFIMSLLLVSVLEPMKQVALSVLESTFLLLFRSVTCFKCCLRIPRKESMARRETSELGELVKRLCLFVAIIFTLLLAGRLFWIIGRIIWLSGEAVILDFSYYQMGVEKRQKQVQHVLVKLGLQDKVQLDMPHIANYALIGIKFAATFLTEHVFYTMSQVCLTTIFALFLLYSPVQRDFSPVMRGVFDSMETYLKLKTYISLIMGVTNGTALAIIGLELPAAWGLMTFCANFIPNIGGPVMSILPCVIALLDVRKTLYQVVAAFTAQFILHFTIANFVEPVVFGTTEKLHSVVILLGLSFFGYIWGITGMFLSVPLLFAVHAWLDTVARTKKYPLEAREDSRFIMGMLEGSWLADSLEHAADDQTEVHVVGEASNEGTDEVNASDPRQRSASPHRGSSHSQLNAENSDRWVLTEELQALFAIETNTGEVRLQGLLLRWVCLIGAYFVLFFGLSSFGLDLSVLIHPTGHAQTKDAGASIATARSSANASSPLAKVASTTVANEMHAITTQAGAALVAASTTTVLPLLGFGLGQANRSNDSITGGHGNASATLSNSNGSDFNEASSRSPAAQPKFGEGNGFESSSSSAATQSELGEDTTSMQAHASSDTIHRLPALTPAPTPEPEAEEVEKHKAKAVHQKGSLRGHKKDSRLGGSGKAANQTSDNIDIGKDVEDATSSGDASSRANSTETS